MDVASMSPGVDDAPTNADTRRTRLEASDVSDAERARAEEFVQENENSPVSIVLRRLLSLTAKGQSVDLLAHDAELSPNQAAGLLKMSRPFLLAFMDRGELPFHRVGTHRRIRMSDLLTFMEQREAGSAIVADSLDKPTSRVSANPLTPEEMQELQELEDF